MSGSNQGNGTLTYPIGLITADEVAFAGGVNGITNQSYYLYTGQDYWTMSPCRFYGGWARVLPVRSYGALGGYNVNLMYGVRPVINLKADVQISSGSGTSSNPYVIS